MAAVLGRTKEESAEARAAVARPRLPILTHKGQCVLGGVPFHLAWW